MRLGSYLALLRENPAFARLYAAQLISFAGDWFATVALLGLALDRTGLAGLAALVLVLQTGGFAVAAPVAGILATGAVEGAVSDYDPATPEVLERVRRIEAVCARHGVPLPAAALQFPLGHPAVASVIPGAFHPDQVRRNVSAFRHPIPADLWAELKAEGLLRADAPVPA